MTFAWTRLVCQSASAWPRRVAFSLPFFTAVAFTPDGAMALAACDCYQTPPQLRAKGRREVPWWWNRGVRAWSLADGQELDLLPLPPPVQALSVSSDSARLLVAGRRFGVWNLANRSPLWDKANDWHNGVAASRDCRLVARGTGERVDNHGPFENTAVELFDGATGELLSVGPHRTPPEAIAFTAGGTSLIAGGLEGELRFWSGTANPASNRGTAAGTTRRRGDTEQRAEHT